MNNLEAKFNKDLNKRLLRDQNLHMKPDKYNLITYACEDIYDVFQDSSNVEYDIEIKNSSVEISVAFWCLYAENEGTRLFKVLSNSDGFSFHGAEGGRTTLIIAFTNIWDEVIR